MSNNYLTIPGQESDPEDEDEPKITRKKLDRLSVRGYHPPASRSVSFDPKTCSPRSSGGEIGKNEEEGSGRGGLEFPTGKRLSFQGVTKSFSGSSSGLFNFVNEKAKNIGSVPSMNLFNSKKASFRNGTSRVDRHNSSVDDDIGTKGSSPGSSSSSSVGGIFSGEGWAVPGFKRKQEAHQSGNRRGARPRGVLSRAESLRLNEECVQKFLKTDVTLFLAEHQAIEKGTLLISPNALMFECAKPKSDNSTPQKDDSEPWRPPVEELIIPMRRISGAALFSCLGKNMSQDENRDSCSQPTSPTEKLVDRGEIVADSTGSPGKNAASAQKSLANFFGVSNYDPTFGGLLSRTAPSKDDSSVQGEQGDSWLSYVVQSFWGPWDAANDDESRGGPSDNVQISIFLKISTHPRNPTRNNNNNNNNNNNINNNNKTVNNSDSNNNGSVKEKRVDVELDEKYWFKIPLDWADRVYAFLVEWIPEEGLMPSKSSQQGRGGGEGADDQGAGGGNNAVSVDEQEELNTFVLLDTRPTLDLSPFNGAAGGQEEEDGTREEGTICPEGGGGGGGGRIMVGSEIKLRSGSEVLCEKTGTVMKSKGRTRAAATGGAGGGGGGGRGGRRAESELIACSVEQSYVKEWEFVHSEEFERRQLRQLERTLPSPQMFGFSHILTPTHVKKLVPRLPSRCLGSVWACMYNSQLDGLSINTLFRKCEPLDSDTCCLLLINPQQNNKNKDKDESSSYSQRYLSSSSSASVPISEPEDFQKKLSQSNLSPFYVYPKNFFGAVLSNPPRISKGKFYGSGQTFLLKFGTRLSTGDSVVNSRRNSARVAGGVPTGLGGLGLGSVDPEFPSVSKVTLQTYQWSGTNNLFCSCDHDHITVGGDNFQAKPALMLDGELLTGQTYDCETFNSPPLTQDHSPSFEISSLEVWAFIPENSPELNDLRVQNILKSRENSMQICNLSQGVLTSRTQTLP